MAENQMKAKDVQTDSTDDSMDEAIKGRESRVQVARVLRKGSYLALTLLMLACIGMALALRLANDNFDREMGAWEVRLNLLADARADSVRRWVKSQKDELEAIAENMSLRLYVTELNFNRLDPDRLEDEPVETQFLQTLISVAAERSGFKSGDLQPAIRANVAQGGNTGIILLDRTNRVVVATEGAPLISARLRQFLLESPKAQPAMLDVFPDADGKPVMAFLVPVFAIQGEAIASQQMGVVLGVKRVAQELYPLLSQPPQLSDTLETLLLREKQGVVEYISPLKDDIAPFSLKLNIDRPSYTAQHALSNPGSFGVRFDYDGQKVLMTSRRIEGTDWVLVHKIGYEEALGAAETRRVTWMALSVSVILALLALLLAAWRYGASVRAEQQAERFRALAKRYGAQQKLLELVAEHDPDAMLMVSAEGQVTFANKTAALNANMKPGTLRGKHLRDVFGAARAQPYLEALEDLIHDNRSLTRLQQRVDAAGHAHVSQVKYLPLAELPEEDGAHGRGMLIVEQDITNAMDERQRRERLLRDLVASLVALIDKRDPYSAQHSAKVSFLAEQIAEQLDMDSALVETAAIAGKLMNLGKMLLPVELLTKKGKLTKKERDQIQEALSAGADLIEELEFDGPVVNTIRQAREAWDGSGPLGISGDNILPTARVVTLANDYIAMTSDRAHRQGMNREDVLKLLMEQIGKRYQRKTVVALLSYLDHQGDELNFLSDDS